MSKPSKRTVALLSTLLIAVIMVGSALEVFQSAHATPPGAVTLANSSTAPTSTGYPFQRSEFSAAGRLWAFATVSGYAGFRTCPSSAACGSNSSLWTAQTNVQTSMGAGSLSVWYDSTSNLVFFTASNFTLLVWESHAWQKGGGSRFTLGGEANEGRKSASSVAHSMGDS